MNGLLAMTGLLLAAAPAIGAVQVKPVEWAMEQVHFRGYAVYDDASALRRPGLLMLPNWRGAGDEAIRMATQIAGSQYVVLVADLYGSDVRPKDDAESLAAVKAVYADRGKTLRSRALKSLDVLKQQASQLPLDAQAIGAVGFCFGGGVALELARTGAELRGGVVSFHGNLDSYQPADKTPKAAILVLNGAADESVPRAQVAEFQQEMTRVAADWQLVDFGGARHCFAQESSAGNPADSNCRYDARAAARAFAMMRAFLHEQFAGKPLPKD
ncbi:dienelactone hydrolase family protein [Tahibacter harae]|uniref:Dienelactone hydrolase family protein n=1 Tax=Tahibacter harae TaxID=2963937 RepID=A0ABT1QPV1_9GAMM|nr:dienelactone hydrolase family protein [Tahibacter harae]MCQ4164311.1 dienelactone hydrolase family protein [Tahibacter harae]